MALQKRNRSGGRSVLKKAVKGGKKERLRNKKKERKV